MMNSPHLSVLYQESIKALNPQSPGRYIDGTVGAGGHAWGILEACSPEGQLLGLDIDPKALVLANQRLSDYLGRFSLHNAHYTTLKEQMKCVGWEDVQGILLDLGVSSMQLDTPERGFSFQSEGPLDMRFDPSQPVSAADLVNGLSESQLADILWRYGEEPRSRQIARAICMARPILSTRSLAEIIRKTAPSHARTHPATLTFQALRIAVNQELQAIETVLPIAVSALSPGGILAVISFHSLEDRIVKQFFHRESQNCICPPRQPVCTCGHKAVLSLSTRRSITPGDKEILVNPRARSARLRYAIKI